MAKQTKVSRPHLRLIEGLGGVTPNNDKFSQVQALVTELANMKRILAKVEEDGSISESVRIAKVSAMKACLRQVLRFTEALGEQCLEELDKAA